MPVLSRFLRAKAANLSHRNFVCPSMSVCHTGGSVKNGAS